jgi:hypothetical protein
LDIVVVDRQKVVIERKRNRRGSRDGVVVGATRLGSSRLRQIAVGGGRRKGTKQIRKRAVDEFAEQKKRCSDNTTNAIIPTFSRHSSRSCLNVSFTIISLH